MKIVKFGTAALIAFVGCVLKISIYNRLLLNIL